MSGGNESCGRAGRRGGEVLVREREAEGDARDGQGLRLLTSIPPHLRPAPLHLRTAPLHLRTAPLHLRTAPLHLRTAPLHLRTAPLHLRTAPLHLRPAPLHLRPSRPDLRASSSQSLLTSGCIVVSVTMLRLFPGFFVVAVTMRILSLIQTPTDLVMVTVTGGDLVGDCKTGNQEK